MGIVSFGIRQVKKIHLTYTQFLIIIFAFFNVVNLFLTPMALYNIVPVDLGGYLLVWVIFGFAMIIFALGLHRVGAFEEAVVQQFDLQDKPLFVRKHHWWACIIAEKMRMSEKELKEDTEKWSKILRVESIN
ncbi:MAG: hypothetical protein ACYTFW_09330 [Planctomycetota bacterium]|jgi:hypothetical protein